MTQTTSRFFWMQVLFTSLIHPAKSIGCTKCSGLDISLITQSIVRNHNTRPSAPRTVLAGAQVRILSWMITSHCSQCIQLQSARPRVQLWWLPQHQVNRMTQGNQLSNISIVATSFMGEFKIEEFIRPFTPGTVPFEFVEISLLQDLINHKLSMKWNNHPLAKSMQS